MLAEALSVALGAAEAARRILLAECARPGGPRGEIGRCPADDEAEWAIRERLLAAFPSWGYLGEETGSQPSDSEYTWYVDPNDGTTSMQRGYRGHAISIGLAQCGTPVLGVVWAVDAPDDDGDLITWAEGCGPLRRNGAPISPRTLPATLGSEDVVALSNGANRNPLGYLACIAPARFIGVPSIAYRLALIAAGDCVATLSLNYLSAWDYAAGHALIRAVGGVVVDEHGRELSYAEGGSTSRVFAGHRSVVEALAQRSWQGVSRSGFGEAAPPPELEPVRGVPGALEHDVIVLSRAQGCLLGLLSGAALAAPPDYMPGQPSGDAEEALLFARRLLAGSAPSFSSLACAGPLGIWGTLRSPEEVGVAPLAVTLAAIIRDKLGPREAHALAPDLFAPASNLEETLRGGGNAALRGALFGAVYGREAIPRHWRSMILSCRPMPGVEGVKHPRPAQYWATDALVMAERLLRC